jgi:ABC-2 type transport system permease protein
VIKAFDIALKDLLRAFRSSIAVVFMFGIPLLVTGMFYIMFGNIASNGEYSLPKTQVIVANLDEGGPRFQISTKNIPGGARADTMGELVVSILESEEMQELIDVTFAQSREAARAAVDAQKAQVAIIIPAEFSTQFADPDAQAKIEFYQDPTLTLGPQIIRAILNRFMDGMASVKIAVNVFLDETSTEDYILVGSVVEGYLDSSLAQSEDMEAQLIEVRAPAAVREEQEKSLLISIITPIMGGMLIFYAYFTGASATQSIIKEQEEGTLQRLFTTPTPQAVILTGKLLAVFLTVLVQVVVLFISSQLIFGIHWGQPASVIAAAAGIVVSAASFGILINSFLKNTKQGGAIYGGLLTVTGMLGMISVFSPNNPTTERLGNTVSLLVPQGWALRGLKQALNDQPLDQIILTLLVLLVMSAAFFAFGVWRFNRRFA